MQDYSLTYKLWNNPEMRRFAEPAPEPHLALFASRKSDDVLVQYDEIREKDETVCRRAYFLRQNADRIKRGEKPLFADPQLTSGMDPVPVCSELSETNNPAFKSLPLFAMSTRPGGQEFVLLRYGATEGPYALPNYVESNANVFRVAFTPFAVAGDTVMVGLVASIVAACMYAAGNIHSW